MSGNIRKQIGLTKSRLQGLMGEVAQLIVDNVPTGLTRDDYAKMRSPILRLITKMERHISSLDDFEAQFQQLLATVDQNDPEHTHHGQHADGVDGYLTVVENAKDLLDDLKARLIEIEGERKEVLHIEESRRTNSIAPTSAISATPTPTLANGVVEPAIMLTQPRDQNICLPKIAMPTFSGDMTKWTEFWDYFESAIHTQTNISDVQKFGYLKTSLSGVASVVIEGLSQTAVNYPTAVRLLKERFADEDARKEALYARWNALTPASPKHTDMRKFIDAAQVTLRQLNVLGEDLANNRLAVQQFQKKVPVTIRLEVEKDLNTQWTLTSLIKELDTYLRVRQKVFQGSELANTARSTKSESKPPQPGQQRDFSYRNSSGFTLATNAAVSNRGPRRPCIFCNENHKHEDCNRFNNTYQRERRLTYLKSCFLCLEVGHHAETCPKSGKIFCIHCQKKSEHNRALCPEKFGSRKREACNAIASNSAAANVAHSSQADISKLSINISHDAQLPSVKPDTALLATDQYAMFQTATVMVRKPSSDMIVPCRIVLDSASHRTFMLQSLAKKLELTHDGTQALSISTFGTTKPKCIDSPFADIEVYQKDGSTKQMTVNILPMLTDSLCREKLLAADLQVLKKYPARAFADPLPAKQEMFCPDILVGQDYWWSFILPMWSKGEKPVELPSGLLLIPSTLGLLLGGGISSLLKGPKPSHSLCTLTTLASRATTDAKLPDEQKDFWSLEAIGISEPTVDDPDEVAMQKFQENITLHDGRYHVCWPWKTANPVLPDNYGLALGRFRSLAHRLSSDPGLLKQYAEVMHLQEKKGIIEKVMPNMDQGPRQHYLPHHPVVKTSSATTKIRIVVDGSAKPKQKSNSLNDCLLSGPNMIADLAGMLLHFRLPVTAILADIEKAFLNLGLQMPDRDVCRFFWFTDPTKPTVEQNLSVYHFTRVPFGIVSIPFLLEAVLNYHLKTGEEENPVNKELILNTYVDNIFLSARSTEEAYQKYQQSKGSLSAVSLNLREWMSNDEKFLLLLPEEDRVKTDQAKVLGMVWNMKEDSISLQKADAVLSSRSTDLTKRTLLQKVASVFDPLGLWSPTTFYGKVLFQSLWKEGYKWDEPLPKDIINQWASVLQKMSHINAEIPRIISRNEDSTYQLVAFTDASQTAYGAAIYLLVTTPTETQANLVFSKMRLTPIKQGKKRPEIANISLPRLELLGVLVGVRSLKFVSKQLKLPLEGTLLFSDSQCVLHWILSSKPLKAFVLNRVTEIRQAEGVQFQYVPTTENPADLLTRGRASDKLICSKLWWKGPDWLCLEKSKWPQVLPLQEPVLSEECEQEYVKSSGLMTTCPGTDLGTYPLDMSPECFSSLKRLLRATVYSLRFLKQLKQKQKPDKMPEVLEKFEPKNPNITAEEMKLAEHLWIKMIQKKNYPDVLQALKEEKSHTLQHQLGLFIDQKGLMRCAGRFPIPDSPLNENFPVLLPRTEIFSKLLVEEVHDHIFHGRVNHTLAELRKVAWIPKEECLSSRC